MMYADDIILCFRANKKSCRTIIENFWDYEIFTSQCLNCTKSEIFFPYDIDRNTKTSICNFLNIKKDKFYFKYLGIMIFPRQLPISPFDDCVHAI